MPPTIRLPRPDGTIEPYVMRDPPLAWTAPAGPIQSRVAFAAAHVVADPLADRDPLSEATLDWEATLARSEEHTSELQSLAYLVCRLLLEKKKNTYGEPLSFDDFGTVHL